MEEELYALVARFNILLNGDWQIESGVCRGTCFQCNGEVGVGIGTNEQVTVCNPACQKAPGDCVVSELKVLFNTKGIKYKEVNKL